MKHRSAAADKAVFFFVAFLFLCVAFYILVPPAATAGYEALIPAGGSPPEFRGLWVARWSLTSPEAVHDMVRLAKEGNLNALLVQVDGQGEALYHSHILPENEVVTPDFDPLASVIKEAHAAGLEVHTWINSLPLGSFDRWPSSPLHPLNQHKDWVMVDSRGKSILNFTQAEKKKLTAYSVEPGLPEVKEFVTSVVLEIVKNYDVDGIHLDYIRYPGRRFGYSPRNREVFAREYGVDPMELVNPAALRRKLGDDRVNELVQAWDQWRRDQVTEVVRRVRLGIMAIRPEVKLSTAIFADLDEAENNIFQDWPRWLKEGLVDFVAPMSYSTDTATVTRQIKTVVALAGDRHVYAGLGAWRMTKQPEKIADKVIQARQAGAEGFILFDYRAMAAQRSVVSYLKKRVFPRETEAPLLPWKVMALTPTEIPRSEQILIQMNLSAKAGQMILIRMKENRLTPALKKILTKNPPGGIILASGGEVKDAVGLADEAQLASLQGKNLVPLWVGWDERDGWPPQTGFTAFPDNLSLAATCDAGLVEKVAMAKAEELTGAGINLLLSRLTLDSGALRGEALTRSFGEDRNQAKAMAQAFLIGVRRRNMTVLSQPLREGEEVEILRFDEFPYRPRVVDLSDLPPGQVRARVMTEAAAGADLFIVDSDPAAYDAVLNGLMEVPRDGVQSPQRLDYSVEKILYLKAQAGIWGNRLHAASWSEHLADQEHLDLAGSAARGAVTLVRDEGGLLGKIAAARPRKVLVLEKEDSASGSTLGRELAGLLGENAQVQVTIFAQAPSVEETADAVKNAAAADLVVVAVKNPTVYGGWPALVRALTASRAPLVVVSTGDPRDLTLFPDVRTYVATYSSDPFTLKAAAGLILGQEPSLGRLPVAIPSLYPLEYGQGVDPAK